MGCLGSVPMTNALVQLLRVLSAIITRCGRRQCSAGAGSLRRGILARSSSQRASTRAPRRVVKRRTLWPRISEVWRVLTTLQCHQSSGSEGCGIILESLGRGFLGGVGAGKHPTEKSKGAIGLPSAQALVGALGTQAGSTGSVAGCLGQPRGQEEWGAASPHGTATALCCLPS